MKPIKYWRPLINGQEFRVARLNDAHALNILVTNPEECVNYIRPKLEESVIYRPDVENMIVICQTVRKQPIGFEIISNGTLDTLLVHPREIFKTAIMMNAHSIILCHNHPSGDPTPSDADVKVTRDLIRAGQLMKIEVMDHIILGNKNAPKTYASLMELGFFYN